MAHQLVLPAGKPCPYPQQLRGGTPGFIWAGDQGSLGEARVARTLAAAGRYAQVVARPARGFKHALRGGKSARAWVIYLGSTLYRIHGSNEPWTIGTQVSSGCIRLRNEDVHPTCTTA